MPVLLSVHLLSLSPQTHSPLRARTEAQQRREGQHEMEQEIVAQDGHDLYVRVRLSDTG